MSHKKNQEKKKYDRLRKVKQKILHKREKIRAEKKLEQEIENMKQLSLPSIRPIRNNYGV